MVWEQSLTTERADCATARHPVVCLAPVCALRGRRLLRLLHKQPRDQQHGEALVGVLAALGLHPDADAAGSVSGAHGRIGSVHVLPAGPCGTHGLEANLAGESGGGAA